MCKIFNVVRELTTHLLQILSITWLCDVFQEIDGDALLLLKSEMMMKYLGLKLGPALKLCYHIDRLKQNRL